METYGCSGCGNPNVAFKCLFCDEARFCEVCSSHDINEIEFHEIMNHGRKSREVIEQDGTMKETLTVGVIIKDHSYSQKAEELKTSEIYLIDYQSSRLETITYCSHPVSEIRVSLSSNQSSLKAESN